MKKITVFLILVSTALASPAQDRYFAYTYTTNVLPKGAIDLELWHTSRMGHLNQFYHAQDQRMETELGLGKNWQTAFYFNRYQTRFSTTANGTENSTELGFSNEWKVKLSDPDKNGVGLAWYGEWGIKGGDELELETKAILDKSFGKNLLAFNMVGEHEREFDWNNNKTSSEKENTVELDLGYMYNISPGLGLGLEVKNHNAIRNRKWAYSALFGGATINFRGDRWFVIGNFLPQLHNLRKTDQSPNNRVLDEQESVEGRIMVGISF